MTKPKRGQHEAKPEPPPDFRGRYESSSNTHPIIRVGNAERAPVDRVDATLDVDLTGRWVHNGGEYHAFINQAGEHIEVLIAMVESGSFGSPSDKPIDKRRSEERLVFLAGDFNHDADAFLVYAHSDGAPIDDSSLACGLIGSTQNGARLVFQLDPGPIAADYEPKKLKRLTRIAKSVAERQTTDPVLLPQHLLQPWIEPEFRTAYLFPLTLAQTKTLSNYILSATVRVADNFLLLKQGGREAGYVALVLDYFEVYTGSYKGEKLSTTTRRQFMVSIGHALDKVVWQAYQDALLRPAVKGGIDQYGIHDWRHASLSSLSSTQISPLEGEPKQSLLELTRKILDGLPGETFDSFLDKLHLAAITGGHSYAAYISLINLGGDSDKTESKLKKVFKKLNLKQPDEVARKLSKRIPLEGTGGLLEIRKPVPGTTQPNKDNPDDWLWEAYYWVAFAGVGGSVGPGGTNVTTSDGHADNVYGHTWDPEQIEGIAYFQDHGGGFAFGPWGKTYSKTYLSCWGTGATKPRTPLQINFSGFGDMAGWKNSSAGTRSLVGTVTYIDSHETAIEIESPPSKQAFEYGTHSETGPIHFPINGAMLELVGSQILQIFAASELVALSRKGCELKFDGYADQPDTEVKNLILSRNRAITCYNYLKNILGARGKHLPELPGIPPEKQELDANPNQDVEEKDISIFDASIGDISITPHGEPPTKPGKKTQYDSSWRRTDIQLNNTLELSLRRMTDN